MSYTVYAYPWNLSLRQSIEKNVDPVQHCLFVIFERLHLHGPGLGVLDQGNPDSFPTDHILVLSLATGGVIRTVRI